MASEAGSAWSAAGTFVSHDGAAFEELAAPDAPGLAPVQCSGQAFGSDRATAAEVLSAFQRGRGLGNHKSTLVTWQGSRKPLPGRRLKRRAWSGAGSARDSAIDDAVAMSGRVLAVVATMDTSARGWSNWSQRNRRLWGARSRAPR